MEIASTVENYPDINAEAGKAAWSEKMNTASKTASDNAPAKRGRGRPKGATSATLTEVRQQAAQEKRDLRDNFNRKIVGLKRQLHDMETSYSAEIAQLQQALEASQKREAAYQHALGEKLHQVADHLHATLINWGDAELEEAQIDKRGRGRPRKTLK